MGKGSWFPLPALCFCSLLPASLHSSPSSSHPILSRSWRRRAQVDFGGNTVQNLLSPRGGKGLGEEPARGTRAREQTARQHPWAQERGRLRTPTHSKDAVHETDRGRPRGHGQLRKGLREARRDRRHRRPSEGECCIAGGCASRAPSSPATAPARECGALLHVYAAVRAGRLAA